jgi:predicted ArsR family transcriptional regulator
LIEPTEGTEMTSPRTTPQAVQGRLAVALYEEFGEAVLPVLRRVYFDYGYEIGRGLREKYRPKNIEEAARAFIEVTNANGYPSSVTVDADGVARFEGHGCPFELTNTHRPVCEALMAMDDGIFLALLGLDEDRIEGNIEQSLAAGDDCCRAWFRVKS